MPGTTRSPAGSARTCSLGGAGDDTLLYARDAVWSGNLRRTNMGSPGVAGTGETVGLNGRNRSFDLFDGGAGSDTLLGTGKATRSCSTTCSAVAAGTTRGSRASR